jgi:hypothetical protein
VWFELSCCRCCSAAALLDERRRSGVASCKACVAP